MQGMMRAGSLPRTHVVAAGRGEGHFTLAGGGALLAVCPHSHGIAGVMHMPGVIQAPSLKFNHIKPDSHGDRHSNGGANLPGRDVRMMVRIGDEAL